MRLAPVTMLTTALTALLVGASACGAGPSTAPDRAVTHRALAAATIEHIGGRPIAAAPVFDSQQQGGLPGGTNIEVALRSKLGYDGRVHVALGVVRRPGGAPTCRPTSGDGDGLGEGLDHADVYGGCIAGREGGRPYRLVWQDEAPEEDPGIVIVTARAGDALVVASLSNPKVRGNPTKGRLAGITGRLVALVTDRAVGLRTSEEYVESGRRISDKVWLDWYGQGNGSPKPKELGGAG